MGKVTAPLAPTFRAPTLPLADISPPQTTEPLPAPRPTSMRFEELTVDLVLAKELLYRGGLATKEGLIQARQLNKRPIRDVLIDRFARLMIAGKWVSCSQTISIADDGAILNGQHRLLALVEAYRRNPGQQPITFTVCYGEDPQNFPWLDKGKMRNAADDFAIAGHTRSHTTVAYAAKLLYFYLAIQRGYSPGPGDAPVPKEPHQWGKIHVDSARLLRVMDDHPELTDDLNHSMRIKAATRLSGGSVITARYLIKRAGNDQERVSDFFEMLRSGQGWPYDNHPAHTLREWSIQRRGNGASSDSRVTHRIAHLAKGPLHLKLLFAAWNKACEGRPMPKPSYRASGPMINPVSSAVQEIIP